MTLAAAGLLLLVHAALLAYSATRHSPTLNEPGHLVAGLTHWQFGRFEVYCVNPPLVHAVSAIPVLIAGYEPDWSGFYDAPGARPEFKMGEDFIRANGERSIWLFTIARWACIPFSLIGGLFCFAWSRELWRSNLAGLISLTLWCFEPNILAHGELITPDCAAASLGLGATWLFWRWLRQPTWTRAAAAGLVLGLAELTKTSWIILFGIWPLLWLVHRWMARRSPVREQRLTQQTAPPLPREPHPSQIPVHSGERAGVRGVEDRAIAAPSKLIPHPSTRVDQPSTINHPPFHQLACILLLALYILNLGYGFDGSFTRLRDFTFISSALTGLEKSGDPGNRFASSWRGALPVPIPKQYLRGIDLQKRDFEDYGQPSYLRGEWKDGGWWYYYIYGLAVKTPHGTQAMLLLSIFTLVYRRAGRRQPPDSYALPPSAAISGRHGPSAARSPLAPLSGRGAGGEGLVSTPDSQLSPPAHRPSSIDHSLLRDLSILLTPPLILLALVSSQLEFNHHVRYVLPVLGFVFVLTGVTARWFARRP